MAGNGVQKNAIIIIIARSNSKTRRELIMIIFSIRCHPNIQALQGPSFSPSLLSDPAHRVYTALNSGHWFRLVTPRFLEFSFTNFLG